MQYETCGDIETFAHFLISILDTPEKINLLTEVRYVQPLILVKIIYLKYYCRSVLSPSDIVHFDQIVSHQEVKVLQHAHSSDTDEENSDEGIICRPDLSIHDTLVDTAIHCVLFFSDTDEAQNYQMVLNAIKSKPIIKYACSS